ncbi:hypothetical protein [Ilumatobacter sp.]|uniref:hypothetical protein n=1 Tax=Ilumatobacter sp. TaxID=1967498 RepID=UPI003B518BE9
MPPLQYRFLVAWAGDFGSSFAYWAPFDGRNLGPALESIAKRCAEFFEFGAVGFFGNRGPEAVDVFMFDAPDGEVLPTVLGAAAHRCADRDVYMAAFVDVGDKGEKSDDLINVALRG